MHALLRTMQRYGWLETDATGTLYGLGVHSLLVGSAYVDSDDVVARTAPVLDTLASERPAAVIGAGTVLDAAAASRAVEAGARFLVSPACSTAVVATAHRHGVVMIPGVLTPSELVAAMATGADLVKLFPASALTPRVVRDLYGPFPQARLVPTGGIAVSEAAAWIAGGATAVGLGGALGSGSPDEVADRVAGLLVELAAARVDGADQGVDGA